MRAHLTFRRHIKFGVRAETACKGVFKDPDFNDPVFDMTGALR